MKFLWKKLRVQIYCMKIKEDMLSGEQWNELFIQLTTAESGKY